MTDIRQDLGRTLFAVLCNVALSAMTLWILRPFLGAIVWATMIVVATWPLMVAVQARLWGKRAVAVTVMTLALLLILVVPLSLAIGTIVSNAETIAGWAKSLASFKVPPPPEWLGKLPVVGGKAVLAWEQVAAAGIEELAAKAAPYAGRGAWCARRRPARSTTCAARP